MVEYMPLLQEYWDECYQGESGYQNYSKESDDTANKGRPGILLLIVQRCPVLPKGDFLKPGEPKGVVDILFIVCFIAWKLGEF